MKKTIIIILLLLALVGISCIYTVSEGHHGLLLRLGKLETDSQTGDPKIYSPGLHFKIPLLNQARVFDTRLQTLNVPPSRIVTEELKDVLVDSYVKWRISDLSLYYTRTGGSELRAETLLIAQLNDSMRAQFGQRNISEVVSGERSDIMTILQQQVNSGVQDYGIKVIDVRIKQIDLPDEVKVAVFERMRTERQRIANQHRADGQSAGEAIRANSDARVTVILAKARSNGQAIRGQGDAQATQIYAEAYEKNPDFFAFYRSINAYEKAFSSKQDILVLKPDSEFFSYFNDSTGTQTDGD